MFIYLTRFIMFHIRIKSILLHILCTALFAVFMSLSVQASGTDAPYEKLLGEKLIVYFDKNGDGKVSKREFMHVKINTKLTITSFFSC